MKGRSQKVIWIVLALVSVGILTAKVSSRRSDPPEKRSTKQGQLVHTSQPRLVQNYGKLPLSFELNTGQTDPQVKFLSRGGGYTMFLTQNEAVLSLKKPSAVSYQPSALRKGRASAVPIRDLYNDWALGNVAQHSLSNAAAFLPRLLEKPQGQTADPALQVQSRIPNPEPLAPEVVRVKLVGANANAKVVGLDPLPGKSNYFIGTDPKKWRTNVPQYAKVKYKDIYPGIDLVYYGNQGHVEHDFIVAPGADPRAIGFEIVGAVREPPTRAHRDAPLRLDTSGDLVIPTDAGEVRLHKPVVYQPTTDNGRPTTDRSFNLQSSIVNHQSVEGRFVLLASNRIAFELSNYDKSLPLIIDPVLAYSTYLGGVSYDQGLDIAIDSSGDAYVTGVADSPNFPTTNSLQPALTGNNFVAKLNAAGNALVYSTYLAGRDWGIAIAVDASGNAYVLRPESGFLTKLNPTGSALIYSTYLGGSRSGIAVDSSGHAYVGGNCVTKVSQGGSAVIYETCLADSGPVIAVDSSGNAYVGGNCVTKLNADGSAIIHETCLGGIGSGDDIAVDSSGNVYITGSTSSASFPTLNPIQPAYGGGYNDAFVAKLNAAGTVVYSTYLGGSGYDYGFAITVDSSGNAYVTGMTTSPNFPTDSPLQPANGGYRDSFVTGLNAGGTAFLYSTYLAATTTIAVTALRPTRMGTLTLPASRWQRMSPPSTPSSPPPAAGTTHLSRNSEDPTAMATECPTVWTIVLTHQTQTKRMGTVIVKATFATIADT